MSTAIERQEVTLAEAMRLTGYTKQNLQHLIDAGHLKRSARAKFKLVDLFAGIMAHLGKPQRMKERSAAQERLIAARAQEIEMRNARAKRELITQASCNETIDLICGDVLAFVGSLPARWTRDRQQRAELEAIIVKEQRRLCERWRKLAQEYEAAEGGADEDGDDTSDEENEE